MPPRLSPNNSIHSLPSRTCNLFSKPQRQQPLLQTQTRKATLLSRPKRPYTFTQLVTLSDGSTFLHRTTSPAPIFKSTKDTRNTPLWNPSSQRLLNLEQDDAGRLASFRERFGRGWDSRSGSGRGVAVKKAAVGGDDEGKTGEKVDAGAADQLMDLISNKEADAKRKKKASTNAKPTVGQKVAAKK